MAVPFLVASLAFGQWGRQYDMYVLAGANRDRNIFYQLLQIVSKPFTLLVRKITPKQVDDRHVPLATFLLLLIVYAVVTFEKIALCVDAGMEGCR